MFSPFNKGGRGDLGFHFMLKYNSHLKQPARNLRSNQTDSEQRLWSKLRRKQINEIQFYRQKPIGNYIVDFYAPQAKLVIEVDGSQHQEPSHQERDQQRDAYLNTLGLTVLRFNNLQVLQEIESVMTVIFEHCSPRTYPVNSDSDKF